jgi:hypothetical protein
MRSTILALVLTLSVSAFGQVDWNRCIVRIYSFGGFSVQRGNSHWRTTKPRWRDPSPSGLEDDELDLQFVETAGQRIQFSEHEEQLLRSMLDSKQIRPSEATEALLRFRANYGFMRMLFQGLADNSLEAIVEGYIELRRHNAPHKVAMAMARELSYHQISYFNKCADVNLDFKEAYAAVTSYDEFRMEIYLTLRRLGDTSGQVRTVLSELWDNIYLSDTPLKAYVTMRKLRIPGPEAYRAAKELSGDICGWYQKLRALTEVVVTHSEAFSVCKKYAGRSVEIARYYEERKQGRTHGEAEKILWGDSF